MLVGDHPPQGADADRGRGDVAADPQLTALWEADQLQVRPPRPDRVRQQDVSLEPDGGHVAELGDVSIDAGVLRLGPADRAGNDADHDEQADRQPGHGPAELV